MGLWKFVIESMTLFKLVTQSSSRSLNMELLLPPRSVRGMKVLDKEMFTKSIYVKFVEMEGKNMKPVLDILKKYSLRLLNFKNEQLIDSTVSDKKTIVLNPTVVSCFDDISEIDRQKLSEFDFDKSKLKDSQLILKYDNWKADEILKAVLPVDKEALTGYSLIGHIVHLNLREHLFEYKNLIGQVLLDKIKQARTVVNKLDTIDNEFRFFKMEILCGDNDMVTEVRENGCLYKFDFSLVYWNPRLSTEHERIIKKIKAGDILYDVFAGVGPFAIPAAKKRCKVLANDLNPESFKWLQHNVKLNKVADLVSVFNKDGNDFIKQIVKNNLLHVQPELENSKGSIHVTMNLPALAVSFLSAFKNLFTADELKVVKVLPLVHLYCFIKGEGDSKAMAKELVEKELDVEMKNNIEEIYLVRNVAPNKDMIRVSFFLTKDILINTEKRKAVDTLTESKRPCLE